jgi:hypothetical protein
VFTGVALEKSVLPCDVIAACSSPPAARDGTERTPLPPPPRRVYSVARRLADSYLAALCCVIQRWVDMSQYIQDLCQSRLRLSVIFGIWMGDSQLFLASRYIASGLTSQKHVYCLAMDILYCCIFVGACLPRISLRGKVFIEALPGNWSICHTMLGLNRFTSSA